MVSTDYGVGYSDTTMTGRAGTSSGAHAPGETGNDLAVRFRALDATAEIKEIPRDTLHRIDPKTEAEGWARMRAHHDHINAMSPLVEQMGGALEQLRAAFADAGVPIADAVHFRQAGDGKITVSGWGVGVAVGHPAASFIEAVLNRDDPALSKLSNKVGRLLDRIENLFSQMQDANENLARGLGEPFTRKSSFFSDGVIMSSEYTGNIADKARALQAANPGEFKEFTDRLGADFAKLGRDQVLARFYFDTMVLPELRQTYPKYFAEA